MKVIGNLDIVKKVDASLPFGAGIQNETETQEGTPVVDDVLQDLLLNSYKLLELTNIEPTNQFDDNATQYQIVDALKRLPNVLNDVEQVLSLDGSVWSVPFDLAILPNKYVFIARASEDYVSGVTYTFMGTTSIEYDLTSNGFKSGDEILVIIDIDTVRVYSLSALSTTSENIYPVMATPIAYNDTNKIRYQEDGKMMDDFPSIYDLELIIKDEIGDSTLILNDVFITNGKVLCFCFIPSTIEYFFRQFNIDDLTVSSAVNLIDLSFGDSVDYSPYVFVSGLNIYITNNANNDNKDNGIKVCIYNTMDASITLNSTVELDASFVKTTNAVIKSQLLYTKISGVIDTYNLMTGEKINIGEFLGVSGQLFSFNNSIYHCTGEVAKKWF
jgi:hypothetical protein